MEVLLWYLAFAVGVNMLMFLLAYVLGTDKLTDISYSLTFIAIALFSCFQTPLTRIDMVLTVLVIIWGGRLGAYLLYRIRVIGKDKRFDHIRGNFKSFFLFWLMQGLTCFIVMIPVIMAHRQGGKVEGITVWIGVLLALAGLGLEAIADAQKFRFKRKQPGSFMHHGVWAYLQHPNYAGELLFWWGMFLACLPFASWGIIIGPLWITYIILGFSGVNLLQQQWQDKYGHDPDFIAYQKSTPKLLPGIF